MAEVAAEMQTTTHKLEDFPKLLCPICFELLHSPRKLPLCFHKFCEKCLIFYVRELEDKQELTDGVKCPVCRQINPGPEQGQDVSEWSRNPARNLELEKEATEKLNQYKIGDVMVEICGGCKDSNNAIKATKLCIDCQEYLCNNCSQFVHKFKAMQGHTILENDLSDRKVQKINKVIADYIQCKKHKDRSVKWHHVQEERFSCSECIFENKGEIRGDAWVSLDDGSDLEELNQKAGNLNKRLKSLKDLGSAIIDQKKLNEAEQKQQTEVIETRIQDIKRQVIGLLDALEEAVRTKCKGLAKDHALTAQNDIESLQSIIGELDFSSSILETSELLGNKRIVHVVVKNLETVLKSKETQTLQLSKECGKESFDLKTKVLLGSLLEVGINDTEQLVVINKIKLPVAFPTYEKSLIQNNFTFTKVSEFGIAVPTCISEPSYIGFTYLADKSLMLVDYCNDVSVSLTSNSKEFTYGKLSVANIKGKLQPFCATYMKKDYAAVSLPSHKTVIFVSKELNQVLLEYYVDFKPKALYAMKNGDLAVSWNEPVAFGVLSPTFVELETKLYFDRDKNGRIFKSFDFMAVDEWRGHIFQSCNIDMAVYCFNFHGVPKFKYAHEKLGQPGGLALDTHGNVFVCGTTTSTIHIMSPEGFLIMLISEDCPKNPINLRLNGDGSQCVVTQANKKTIHVFSVKKSK